MVSPIFHKEATLIKTQTRMSAINDAILNLVVARSRAVWKIVIRLVALVSHLDCDRPSQLVTIPLCYRLVAGRSLEVNVITSLDEERTILTIFY